MATTQQQTTANGGATSPADGGVRARALQDLARERGQTQPQGQGMPNPEDVMTPAERKALDFRGKPSPPMTIQQWAAKNHPELQKKRYVWKNQADMLREGYGQYVALHQLSHQQAEETGEGNRRLATTREDIYQSRRPRPEKPPPPDRGLGPKLQDEMLGREGLGGLLRAETPREYMDMVQRLERMLPLMNPQEQDQAMQVIMGMAPSFEAIMAARDLTPDERTRLIQTFYPEQAKTIDPMTGQPRPQPARSMPSEFPWTPSGVRFDEQR